MNKGNSAGTLQIYAEITAFVLQREKVKQMAKTFPRFLFMLDEQILDYKRKRRNLRCQHTSKPEHFPLYIFH